MRHKALRLTSRARSSRLVLGERSVDRVGTIIIHVAEGIELIAEDNGRGHTVYCLKDGVIFYPGEQYVKGWNSP